MRICTVTAHAGCLNTKQDSLESLNVALSLGADIAELDINFSKNNKVVLKHNKITGEEVDLVELRDVFKFIKNKKIKLNLDIKNKEVLKYIEELAEEFNIIDKLILSGLDENDTIMLLNENYQIKYLMNVEVDKPVNNKDNINKYIQYALKSKAIGLNIDYNYCSYELIKEAHKNNLIVSLWTIDEEEIMDKFLDYLVDNITTNKPNILLEKLEYGKR